ETPDLFVVERLEEIVLLLSRHRRAPRARSQPAARARAGGGWGDVAVMSACVARIAAVGLLAGLTHARELAEHVEPERRAERDRHRRRHEPDDLQDDPPDVADEAAEAPAHRDDLRLHRVARRELLDVRRILAE